MSHENASAPAAPQPESAPEAATGEVTVTSRDEPTRWARFAAWRRRRPFWGALLVVLAGLELWFSGRLQLDNFEIHLGIEGAQSTLLPVGMVLLGVLVLSQPQFRVFYGVISLAVAVYSLMGVNFGGLGVGMILGVVGGILVVSWMPRPAVGDAGTGEAAETVEAVPDDEAFEALLPFDDEPARGGRHVAVVAAVAVLALGGTGMTVTPTASAAPSQVRAASDCWDPLGWLEWACGGDDGDEPAATPSPSPSATADAEGDAAADGDADTDGDVADDGSGDDSPSAGASDGAAEGPDAQDDGTEAADENAGGDKADGDKASDDKADDNKADGDKAGDDKAGDDEPQSDEDVEDDVEKAARLELGPCARITFGGEYDLTVSLPGDCGVQEDANVFSRDSELETRDLQLPLTGINGIDVVNVPVTTDGPRRDALRLSVDSVKVPGFWLKTYADNDGTLGGTVTGADYVSMEGNAQMYISSIHANLPDGDDLAELGDQIADGASLVEILLGLVDARIGLMGATSDVQVWSDFREQVWED